MGYGVTRERKDFWQFPRFIILSILYICRIRREQRSGFFLLTIGLMAMNIINSANDKSSQTIKSKKDVEG